MKLFRNPEIQRFVSILFILVFLTTIAGFLVGVVTGIFIFVTCVILVITFFIYTSLRYQKMDQLSERMDRVLHGDYTLDFDEYCEGEMAVLKDELDKVIMRLKEQGENLNKEKIYLADSVADISHQLRTPLTSINIIIEFLKQEDLDYKKRMQLIKDMQSLLGKIEWQISALLKISKIDAGTIKMKSEPVNVNELIKKALEPFLVLMDIKEQKVNIISGGEETFKGDFLWSSEALGNILKNCTEHIAPGGNIFIESEENPIYTEIVIRDDGQGFDKEDIPYLFNRFYKGKNSDENSVGIGLAISKMIITSQNGVIKAENGSGGGAKFIIRFYKVVV